MTEITIEQKIQAMEWQISTTERTFDGITCPEIRPHIETLRAILADYYRIQAEEQEQRPKMGSEIWPG